MMMTSIESCGVELKYFGGDTGPSSNESGKGVCRATP